MDIASLLKDMFEESVDPDKFLKEEMLFSLVHNEVFSVDNMSDREVRESILEDLLEVAAWESKNDAKLNFTVETLVRFISNEKQKLRVFNALCHPEITLLLTLPEEQLRIKSNWNIQQAAMDYCGVWHEGHEIPGVGIIDQKELSKKDKEDLVNKLSGVFLEISSNVPGNKTVH